MNHLENKINGREGRSSTESEGERKIQQSIAYMRQHFNEPLQVARLATLVNVSPSHYFALFKRRTGCAPIDYFIRLRMRRACDLLMATSLNVKEVAAALGYEDPFYFSRVFKSVNRVAPSEYRAMMAEMRRTERNVATIPSEREDLSSQHPGTELIENNGWSERTLHEKHSIIHSKQECILR